jgi:hypothetical protein
VAGYTFASTSVDSIRASNFFMSLMVCSARVRVRICVMSVDETVMKTMTTTYGVW